MVQKARLCYLLLFIPPILLCFDWYLESYFTSSQKAMDIFIRLGEKCYLTFFYWQISMKTVTNTAFIVI